jgi:Apoptosis-inducing factor, mitochondrion-associated, C-term
MAGKAATSDHLPLFPSDFFDLGYEAVRELDAGVEIAADWKEPFREGVLYYLRDGRVRGVLLWNIWNQLDAARHLIGETEPFQADDLIGRLPAWWASNGRDLLFLRYALGPEGTRRKAASFRLIDRPNHQGGWLDHLRALARRNAPQNR